MHERLSTHQDGQDSELRQFLRNCISPACQLDRHGSPVYTNPAFDEHCMQSHLDQLQQAFRSTASTSAPDRHSSKVAARVFHTQTQDQTPVSWTLTPSPEDLFICLAQSWPPEHFTAPINAPINKPAVSSGETGDWRSQHRFSRIATGGGEMGERVRNHDWSQTELGPLESWSQALVDLIGFTLHSPLPTMAYVGPNALAIYNDAYIPVFGSKHPVLASPGRVAWKEILNHIDEPLWRCYKHGEIQLKTRHQLFFNRISDTEVGLVKAPEEVYATWAYEPWMGADHKPVGVLHSIFEQTQLDNISARRLEVITTLGAVLAAQGNLIDLCRSACKSLSTLERDLPYCIAYTCSPNYSSDDDKSPESASETFVLQETVGCPFDSAIAPVRLPVNLSDPGYEAPAVTSEGHFWQKHLDEMCQTKKPVDVVGVRPLLEGLPKRGFSDPVRAVIIPLIWQNTVSGCFIFLLSPTLPYHEGSDLKQFIDILDRQLNFGLQGVRNYEFEVQRREELAAIDNAKTSFFTSVSHELRTPLTLILGPVNELKNDTTLSKSSREHVSMVSRNARRLLRLVNSILDFARCEAGKMNYNFEPIKIGSYTLELAKAFRPLFSSNELRYTVTTQRCEDAVVWVDIDKYDKIMSNLIGNARKFTHHGAINIHLEARADSVQIDVSDTGVGIPADQLSNIFEKFHRVENPRAKSVEGSGIGLSLTMELVKAHGGKLKVDSIYGQGSTFSLTLPLGTNHLPQKGLKSLNTNPLSKPESFDVSDFFEPQIRQSSTSSSDGEVLETRLNFDLFAKNKKPTVLIADDNVDMRIFIKSILSSYCTILEAEDGQQAIDLVRNSDIDLLLCDIQMPKMSGLDVLTAIRSDPQLRHLLVILISARAGEEASVEGLASGADDYLIKPFVPKELLLRVHQHLQLLSVRIELEKRVQERTAALEESKKSFQRLSELLQVGVHRSDPSGHIVWANKLWHQVLHLDTVGWNNWEAQIHPDDRDRAIAAYSKAVATGKGYHEPVEMRLLAGPNSPGIDITYDLQAEIGDDGACIGFVGVFSDVTALRRLERERVEIERGRREEAERNRAMQEEFIDSICHELRNPMQAIVALAELLGESLLRMQNLKKTLPTKDLPKEWLEIEGDIKDDLDAVSTIILCSRHQKRIADDVLHVSKISGNLISLSDNEFAPAQSIADSVKMFALEISAKSINLTVQNHPSCNSLRSHLVVGDDGRFQQILVNLLANAIKFSETSTAKSIKVKLGLSKTSTSSQCPQSVGTYTPENEMLPCCEQISPSELQPGSLVSVWVAVADSGPGMSLDEQSRIFERFVQASPKTYREFGGVGLGLYISRKLVELQGGRIFLESTKGVGTIFRFYVNVKVANAQSTQPIHYPSPSDVPTVDQIQAGALSFSGQLAPDGIKSLKIPDEDEKPHVLVVEDNKINQKVLCRLLHDIGFVVTMANDGADCLKKVDEQVRKNPTDPPFDLILMDLEMPIMDGMTATQKLRELEAKGKWSRPQKIVAVTANARQMFEEQAKAIGMDGFLRKPYSKTELFACVQQHLKR